MLECYIIMGSEIESESSKAPPEGDPQGSGWLRLGLVAAASALAGGVAAAWWYRKTLNKLHESGENTENSHFGISVESPAEDPYDEI